MRILYLRISEMHTGLAAVREKIFFKVREKVREFCEKLGKIFGYGKVREKFGDLEMNAHNKSIVLSSRSGGRAGGWLPDLQNPYLCNRLTDFPIQSFMELSGPLIVQHHLPICPIWACPWAQNLSNLAQIGSRLCRMHIYETAGWIYHI